MIDEVEFICRTPVYYDNTSPVMILFGGRNWDGEKTLARFDFNELADKHNIFLLAPSFKEGEYWLPESGSGKTLRKAIEKIREDYRLNEPELYFYGYSAGGRCAALFYLWMAEKVAAWGAHDSVFFPGLETRSLAPALLTCGYKEGGAFAYMKTFACQYREAGGSALLKSYPVGHELNAEALALAQSWFAAVISGDKPIAIGEDDSGKIIPVNDADEIDVEYRNELLNESIMELWQR